MGFASGLYFGRVLHRRTRPRSHTLRYRFVSALLDLDELPDLASRLRLFSYNAANLFSFHDSDHGAQERAPLRGYVEAQMREAGVVPDGGPIRLLCAPRVLGLAFNPLSTFYCHRRDGTLAAMLYEVRNTFGQRHSYMIPVAADSGAEVRQSCAKQFHVSPFMAMAVRYRFRVTLPENSLSLCIHADDADGTILFAAFTGVRREFSDARLLRMFLRRPLPAGQVLGGIHWEALKLWRKGTGLHPLPPPPARDVTIVKLESPEEETRCDGLPRSRPAA
jgi:DUF1365 family protein